MDAVPSTMRTTFTAMPDHHSRIPLHGSIATTGLGFLASGMIIMAVPWAFLSGGSGPVLAGLLTAGLHVALAVGMAGGGYLVDRLGARPVLLATDGISALTAVAAAAILLAGGSPWLMVTLLALSNLSGSPGSVAQDARIPELAQLARIPLERANALREIAGTIGQLGGPAGGVVLVELVGLGPTLAVAAGLLLVIWVVDLLTFPSFATPASTLPAPSPLAGVRHLIHDRGLRVLTGLGILLVSVFHSLDEVLAPNLALSSGNGGYALAGFLALAALSALGSAASYAAWGSRWNGRTTFLSGIGCSALGFVLLTVLPGQVGFLLAPIGIGLGIGPLWPIVITAVQQQTAPELRGSVIGALSAVVLLAQPVAALIAAPCVLWLGPAGLTLALTCAVVAVAAVAPFLSGLTALLAQRQTAKLLNQNP